MYYYYYVFWQKLRTPFHTFCWQVVLFGVIVSRRTTYNHTTSNLAIYAHETARDKLSEAWNRKSIIVIQVHDKLHEKVFISTCSFLWKMKVVEHLFKIAYGEKLIYWKYICCRYTLELPHRGNSNVHLQHMLLKIRKKINRKFTFSKYHVHCLYLF